MFTSHHSQSRHVIHNRGMWFMCPKLLAILWRQEIFCFTLVYRSGVSLNVENNSHVLYRTPSGINVTRIFPLHGMTMDPTQQENRRLKLFKKNPKVPGLVGDFQVECALYLAPYEKLHYTMELEHLNNRRALYHLLCAACTALPVYYIVLAEKYMDSGADEIGTV